MGWGWVGGVGWQGGAHEVLELGAVMEGGSVPTRLLPTELG